jgi:hypothetical protein
MVAPMVNAHGCIRKIAVVIVAASGVWACGGSAEDAAADGSDLSTAATRASVDVWSDAWCAGDPVSEALAKSLLGGDLQKSLGSLTFHFRERTCVPNGTTAICNDWAERMTGTFQLVTSSLPKGFGEAPRTLDYGIRSNGPAVVPYAMSSQVPVSVVDENYVVSLECDTIFSRPSQTCDLRVSTPTGGDNDTHLEIAGTQVSKQLFSGASNTFPATLRDHCFRMNLGSHGNVIPAPNPDRRYIDRQVVLAGTF